MPRDHFTAAAEIRKVQRELGEVTVSFEQALDRVFALRERRNTLERRFREIELAYAQQYRDAGEEGEEPPVPSRPNSSDKVPRVPRRRRGETTRLVLQEIKEQPGVTKKDLRIKIASLHDSFFTKPGRAGMIRVEAGKCFLTPDGEAYLCKNSPHP
jgi:hypothetical protein